MKVQEFVKEHKKEIIVGGVILVGVTAAVIIAKTKKSAPKAVNTQFAEVAARMASKWDATPDCVKMHTGACRLSDFDRYAKYVQSRFSDDPDHVLELIIAHSPNEHLMNTPEFFHNKVVDLPAA